jgi:hypothetical protein
MSPAILYFVLLPRLENSAMTSARIILPTLIPARTASHAICRRGNRTRPRRRLPLDAVSSMMTTAVGIV